MQFRDQIEPKSKKQSAYERQNFFVKQKSYFHFSIIAIIPAGIAKLTNFFVTY